MTIGGQLNVGENVVVTGNNCRGPTTPSETVNIADNIIVLVAMQRGTSQDGGIALNVEMKSTTHSCLMRQIMMDMMMKSSSRPLVILRFCLK